MEAFTKNLDQIIETFERNIIEKALKDTHGNQSKAALLLGISKRKIQYKICKHGINWRTIKENNGTTGYVLHAWHHFSHANKIEERHYDLLLP